MRNPDRIEVQHGILHLVGDGRDRDTVLSEDPLELADMPEAKHFVENHILNSLNAEQSIAAKFTDNVGIIRTACHAIFGNVRQFTAATKRMATCLGNIVQQDARVAPGGLLLARFTYATNGGPLGVHSHIAILKLDPSDGFAPQTQHRNGHTCVTLRKIDRVVPSTREQLQKCAFVCNPAARDGLPEGCDLLLLDRQRRGVDQAADFFVLRFLGAARVTDDKSLTKAFDDIATRTINALYRSGLVDDEVRNELYTHRTAALRSQRVIVPQFVENLPINAEAKAIARNRFAVMLDQEFAPDEETAIKLTRMMKFRGDHNLQLSIEEAYYNDVVETAEKILNDPERGTHWRIVLRSREWQPVRAR